jgi:hypothetical protein
MKELWVEYTLKEGIIYYWQIGLRKLWIKHQRDEWLVATELLDGTGDLPLIWAEDHEIPERPEDIVWQRILCNTKEPKIRFKPMAPNKPVMVDSETTVTVMPKNSGLFYVLFRCWIALQVGDDFESTLMELPTIGHSESWFGVSDSGYSCYSLKTSARRTMVDEEIPSYKIICPVLIRNQSATPLDFSKISVQTAYLKIFSDDNQLWTNEVRISYQGPDKGSVLKYSDKVPKGQKGDFKMLSDHRVSPKQNLIRRSLSLIKNIADLNGV